MMQTSGDNSATLLGLGWASFFSDQLGADEADLIPTRIASVHRTRLGGMAEAGPYELVLPPHTNTGDYAVGDWVLVEPYTGLLRRRLDRKSVLERRLGDGTSQLGGANIDTLFVVTSCNADFNIARLERFLALANQAGTVPVLVLTKADTSENAELYREQASSLQRDLPIVIIDARAADAGVALAPWCGVGQTVAVVGSSGVGKSTLVNTLAGSGETVTLTGDIREHDSKGKHTTTARSLHAMASGGWIIDTPGIRTLHVGDMTEGLDTVFAEITELTSQCRFRDCTHAHEPGCAVQAAVASGAIDGERLARWRKLQDERPAKANGRGRTAPSAPRRRR